LPSLLAAGSANHPHAAERFEGYKKSLEDAAIQFDPKLVAIGAWHEEGGLRATLELLNSNTKFTALCCVNPQTASDGGVSHS
jgi:DNA-binding LacI/PurR family transcriptional regulator